MDKKNALIGAARKIFDERSIKCILKVYDSHILSNQIKNNTNAFKKSYS